MSDLLRRMREGEYVSATCNRVLVLLRYAFNLGRKWKTPGVSENLTVGLATGRQVSRDRFLQTCACTIYATPSRASW